MNTYLDTSNKFLKERNVHRCLKGRYLKSSILVLNSEMQVQEVSEIDGLKIQQVAKSIYQGHLFAVDADQNLVAIDIKLVCQGVRPYRIMSSAKQGDSKTLMSVDGENVWLLHAAG